MKKYEFQKYLEDQATKITDMKPIKDCEYQKITYSRISKGVAKQERKEYFKSSRKII